MSSIGDQIEAGNYGPEWTQRLPDAAEMKEIFDRLERSERGHVESSPMMKADVFTHPAGQFVAVISN